MNNRVYHAVAIAAAVVWLGCGTPGVDIDRCLSADQMSLPDTIAAEYDGSTADTAWANRVNGEYDRFTDTTTVSTGSVADELSRMTGSSSRAVAAHISCEGRGGCSPDSVRLVVQHTSESRAIPDSARVIFLLGGSDRVRYGPANVAARTEKTLAGEMLEGLSPGERARTREELADRDMPTTVIREVATFRVSYAEFVELACADSVEYSVGEVEGDLDHDKIMRFRLLTAVAENRVSLRGL